MLNFDSEVSAPRGMRNSPVSQSLGVFVHSFLLCLQPIVAGNPCTVHFFTLF